MALAETDRDRQRQTETDTHTHRDTESDRMRQVAAQAVRGTLTKRLEKLIINDYKETERSKSCKGTRQFDTVTLRENLRERESERERDKER